jgi:hypothetical protein
MHAPVTADPDEKYKERRIMPNEVLRSESYRTVNKSTFDVTVEHVGELSGVYQIYLQYKHTQVFDTIFNHN